MRQGTVSVFFGVHSPIHSTLVLFAWVRLYHNLPLPWQLICIYLHDIGHIGKNYLDNPEEKAEHWELGAEIAGKLFGQKGFDFCAGHCHNSGIPASQLLKPDKYSWYIAPRLWLLSNVLVEPKVGKGSRNAWESVLNFKQSVKINIESGEYGSTHALYLKRSKQS